MALLKRLRVLAAKVETTSGTAESLTATEGAFNAYDVDIQANITVEGRESQGSFGNLSGVAGARAGSLSFKTDLAWDGTATVPSFVSVMMPGCGFVNSSGTVTPRSEAPGSNVKTLTLAVYENGLKKTLAGASGTFKIVCPAGRMTYIEWTFTGVWQAPTDTTIIAPTYPTAAPLRYASATSTYNSVALPVESVTFDMGNVVTLLEDPSTAAAYSYAIVTDRKPMITCNPESVLVAGQDRFGMWLAATEAEFTVTLDGPSNATLAIQAPKAQIVNVQESDRNRVQVDDVTLSCNKNGATADQEVSLIFTAAV